MVMDSVSEMGIQAKPNVQPSLHDVMVEETNHRAEVFKRALESVLRMDRANVASVPNSQVAIARAEIEAVGDRVKEVGQFSFEGGVGQLFHSFNEDVQAPQTVLHITLEDNDLTITSGGSLEGLSYSLNNTKTGKEFEKLPSDSFSQEEIELILRAATLASSALKVPSVPHP